MTNLGGADIAPMGLSGWVFLLERLQTRIDFDDYATGLDLVAAIGALAIERDHHPDLDLRYRRLDIRLSSHDVGGVTSRDTRMAKAITALAAERGLTLSNRVGRLDLALNTADFERVNGFWAAVLGGDLSDGGTEVKDTDGVLPDLWFQAETQPEPRLHWHLDLYLDPEHIEERLRAALAAGGTLVDESFAPSWWVLADAEGNTICLCTWQPADRDRTQDQDKDKD